ncbi:Oxo-4-hydroxy-4-carboxy-5-ureidoimidazoline decarboxylase [Mycena floridula]|nr:Oxo-4-hydroxy-4-carboxy-5-ureidoimidazoline decarboxylase [Mycena floridula]
MSLPSLEAVQCSSSHTNSPLAIALCLLFESSPILLSTLEPQVAQILSTTSLVSFSQLIDISLAQIVGWNLKLQSEFISGHPRIGESKNLSILSAAEQGATPAVGPTPPEVLARLAHLNECYERQYPGLRYITFVNGRTRAVIAEEMEGRLGLDHSLSPVEPPVSSLKPVEVEGEDWRRELARAVDDIGYIAKSRLQTLGVK